MRKKILPPPVLSRELREGESADLTRRRWGIGLSFGGLFIGAVVGAYQTGIIKKLPDILPGKIWDAQKVDASDYAYQHLQMPDAMQMIFTYGVTAALISAGGKDRAKQNPLLPIAAAAKSAFDFLLDLALARSEWKDNKKLCSWCQTATLVSAATLALTIPEARRARDGIAAQAG